MTMITQGNPTAPVRSGEELDWQALDRRLKEVIPGLDGRPEISQFASGNSNLTYRLKYAAEDLVVRRPPFGTKAKSAHSMIREYRIMNALKPVYPWVPDTLYYTDDESVIGSEFYVMRKVEGQVIKQTIPADWGFTPADTRRLCRQFWEKLIELHQVDYRAAGLEDFGQPKGYMQRQVLGWNGRYQRVITPDVDEFSDVRHWLETNKPPESGNHAILHGDYRIDNIILSNRDPTAIRAVLDWEICALGEPLMDLGNALAYWIEPDDPPYLKALQMQPSTAEGMLTRTEILALYSELTGRDTAGFLFYLVFGYFRNAVILQQIYYRFYHGQTQDERFRSFGAATRNLGEHCRRLILAG
ncbi:MAG: phosphotransferase family protein [Proteobacteria bacterium]|nr:phosphotransferase family protein [Pseudomonadota bacterium]